MGQQRPPGRGPIFLWLGIILLLAACCLYIYASIAKQNFIISIVSPALSILGLLFSILSYQPSIVPQLRQSIKTGLLVFFALMLLVSLSLNGYLIMRLYAANNHTIVTPSVTLATKPPTRTVAQRIVPKLVQKNFYVQNEDTVSSNVTFRSSVTSGDLILVAITQNLGTVSNVTDNHSNTYLPVMPAQHSTDSPAADYVELYYAKNVIGGPTTVTATFSISGGNIGIFEYSGLDARFPLDQKTYNVGSGTTPNGGTLNVTTDHELYFAIGVDDSGGNKSLSAGSGYILEYQEDDSVHHERFYAEDRISPPGIYQTGFSLAAQANWAVIGASFKPT